MPGENGQGVKDPNAAGAGAPAGEGAENKSGEQGGQAGGVVDQEFEVTTPAGTKVKVRASDIVDDQGVPFKNRAAENARKAREAQEALATVHQERETSGGSAPEVKAGEFVDPLDGTKYTEDDINRMYMTGEGLKAQRIVLARVDVRREVTRVVQENDTKVKTVAKYPDLVKPNTPMFQRVAKFMSDNDLYGKPGGLAAAAAAVAEQLTDEGIPFSRQARGSAEAQRGSQSGAGVIPGGGGNKGGSSTPELDDEGKRMAQKLGVDPAKMAARLQNHLNTRGTPREGRE